MSAKANKHDLMRPERILVIEDDPGIAVCVEMLLSSRGYACAVFNDGASGLAHLAAEQVDLLITDLRLIRRDSISWPPARLKDRTCRSS
jgi:DNA-binding response OmpR family regulator